MNARHVFLVLAVPTACITEHNRPERAAFGDWRVTGSTCPNVCAMSPAESDGWRGRTATYTDSIARFADDSCVVPQYNPGIWSADNLYGGARLADLGITRDSVTVIEIRCPSYRQTGTDPRWQVPGAFLLIKDRHHLLTMWDGVLFELTRQ